MAVLGVIPANVVTRVTEYMDEIVAYIQRIIDQKFAYESNGSVYFDVACFEGAQSMHYCKLAPEQIFNASLLAEGEGKLTQDFVDEKHSPRRLCSLEKIQNKRTKLGIAVGSWSPGVAHRMLRHGE